MTFLFRRTSQTRAFETRLPISVLLAAAVTVGCASGPTSVPIESGTRAASRGGHYSLLIPEDGWHTEDVGEVTFAPSTPSAPSSDSNHSAARPSPTNSNGESSPSLALSAAATGSWIVGYHFISNQPQIDSVVAERRELLLKIGARDFRERRSFVGPEQGITASLSRYTNGREVILVLTAIRSPLVVEIVSGTIRGGGHELALIRTLETIDIRSLDGVPR